MKCEDCHFWNNPTESCADFAGYVDEDKHFACRYSDKVCLVTTVECKIESHAREFMGIHEDMYKVLALEITQLLTNDLNK